MEYIVRCPHCGAEIDSMDSYADSKEMLNTHIEFRHPINSED